jgi:hypothetical protein
LEEKMKGYYKIVVMFVLLALVLPACGGAQPAGSTTKDYLNMSWDQIVEEAKAEKEMVFYMCGAKNIEDCCPEI